MKNFQIYSSTVWEDLLTPDERRKDLRLRDLGRSFRFTDLKQRYDANDPIRYSHLSNKIYLIPQAAAKLNLDKKSRAALAHLIATPYSGSDDINAWRKNILRLIDYAALYEDKLGDFFFGVCGADAVKAHACLESYAEKKITSAHIHIAIEDQRNTKQQDILNLNQILSDVQEQDSDFGNAHLPGERPPETEIQSLQALLT